MFPALFCRDRDGAVLSVRLEIGRFISNEVAAANLVAQFIERLPQGIQVTGKQRLSATACASVWSILSASVLLPGSSFVLMV